MLLLQKFIELLRSGTAGDRDSAIQCLRVDLAPRALDAYPVSNLLFGFASFNILANDSFDE